MATSQWRNAAASNKVAAHRIDSSHTKYPVVSTPTSARENRNGGNAQHQPDERSRVEQNRKDAGFSLVRAVRAKWRDEHENIGGPGPSIDGFNDGKD